MNRTLSISPDVNNPAFRATTFDEMREAYAEEVRGLIDGGVDLLLVETIFDTLNAKAALVAIEEVFESRIPNPDPRPPVMISVTVTDRSGRTLSGQTIDAFWVSIAHVKPFSVGINCALGARDMRPYLAELARIADCYISCHPNAGLPNAFGLYDEQPDETAAYLREFAESGFLNIVGGCCGTTPEHIAAIAKAVDGLPPRSSTTEDTEDTETDSPPCQISARIPGCALHAVRRPRDADDPPRLELSDDRRADERDRLGAIRAVDPGRAVRRGGARGARPGPRRRQSDRREHGRRHARLRAGDDGVPELHRDGARDRARAVHDRQLEVVRDSRRPQVRAGEAGRQLDQPEGRRRGFPAEGGARPALRRRRGRDGVRREGPGRHGRAEGLDLPARVPAADRARRLRPV